jgi:putative phosphoribosyl transferase
MLNIKIPLQQESETSVQLEGDFTVPTSIANNSKGIVIFAHGSGSSRHSPRNHSVAQLLNRDGLATLLVDLLTHQEEETDIRTQRIQSKIPGLVLNKFNIKLLSKRLLRVTDWLLENEETKHLANNNIGYFGASTGAAAALIASGERPNVIGAIVSRGGRPDLATPPEILTEVFSPTLLIVGGNDKPVIELNNKTLTLLKNVQKKKVVIVPGATHLFEEPGTLEEVARLASGWFRCYFQIRQHDMN